MTDTTSTELDQILDAATEAAPILSAAAPATRAGWLRAAADALDAHRDELVPLAIKESHLPEARLTGEVGRTSGQLRMFADALESGWLSEYILDSADPEQTPPRPDLRRELVGLGPVLVFGASNFPFAFSVCGGDTASALAAGCPVVAKAHPGHPETSRRTAQVAAAAMQAAGAPAGILQLIEGFEVGTEALKDRRIRAGGFTGSEGAGTALHRIAATRPDPIPFYGELGSTNPAFVLPGALADRPDELISGYVGSMSLGVGQFCTSPGILLLPAGHGLSEKLAQATAEVGSAQMLNDRVYSGYAEGAASRRENGAVQVLTAGTETDEQASPTLLATTVPEFLGQREELMTECFGPLSIIVEYADEQELLKLAAEFGGQLTCTVQGSDADTELAGKLLPLLSERAGRVIWNAWPTGVAVSWAMQHGGPFPATVGSIHTSVGITAARRFQRPVCYQDVPQALLPEALRDGNPLNLLRTVDGELARH
ncbi:aldehyde dehydrogenase (NADP(+)) [Enemella evansiae]|uniref:aldehyde dehydrogenase (NADP(+)) n=1 Tax=Enemella evansiae TaxID=2016499 RepID=UPI000B966005|nr:aldehyde dehydrogenase (NADP(+)) [Enemella evansiae]OYO02473.1 aldehyde dehydrogenase (NADP(+)) [Enemella evansiae]